MIARFHQDFQADLSLPRYGGGGNVEAVQLVRSSSKLGCAHQGGMELIAQREAQIPDPLRENPPKLPSAG
jgi:hypothetical protein